MSQAISQTFQFQRGLKAISTRVLAIIVALALFTMVAACGTLVGAGVGAGAGAAIGAGTGNVKRGALIGTGVGAAAGAIYDFTR